MYTPSYFNVDFSIKAINEIIKGRKERKLEDYDTSLFIHYSKGINEKLIELNFDNLCGKITDEAFEKVMMKFEVLLNSNYRLYFPMINFDLIRQEVDKIKNRKHNIASKL